MAFPFKPLTLSALALVLAQGAPPCRAENTNPESRKVQKEANRAALAEWWLQRLGGQVSSKFISHLHETAKQEQFRHPSQFPNLFREQTPLFGDAATTWVNLGPFDCAKNQNGGYSKPSVDSGRTRQVYFDPSDPSGNTVFTLGPGGLFKTSNFRSADNPTWTCLTDNLGVPSYGGFAFGKKPGTIYLASGDQALKGVSNWYMNPFSTSYIFKSTDGGKTWKSVLIQQYNETDEGVTYNAIADIKVDTSGDKDVIIVATSTGIFYSDDEGNSYKQSSSTINKSAHSLVKTSAGWIACATVNSPWSGIYLSTDKGITWTLKSGNGWPAAPSGTSGSGTYRTTLAVGQPGDAVVYAFAAKYASSTGSEQYDLFKSIDGGLTWTASGLSDKKPTNPNSHQQTMDIMADQASYNQMLLVDKTDSARNTVYIGGQYASAKSTDGGATWTLTADWLPYGGVNLPYVHADYHACDMTTTNDGAKIIIFGTDGGLFVTKDDGATFDYTRNRGLATHKIYAFSNNESDPTNIIIGLQDAGSRLRVNTQGTFNQTAGGDGFGNTWTTGTNPVITSTVYYNKIRRSNGVPDDISKWSDFMTGLPGAGEDTSSWFFVTPLYQPPTGADPTGSTIYTYSNNGTGPASKKVYKTTGSTWTVLANLPSGRAVRAVSHGVGVSPKSLNHIALACNGGYVVLSTDGGASWTQKALNSLVPGSAWVGYNANVVWADNTKLYVCSEAVTPGVARVAKSLDGGTSWTRSDTGLPDVPVVRLLVDPSDPSGNTVFAATWLGVYKTTNGGTAWSLHGTGLPQVMVSDLWISQDGKILRAATYGRGVWELSAGSTATAPSITKQPSAITVNEGGVATFTVEAAGTQPFTYLWQKNGADVPNSNAATLTFNPVKVADAGTYTVKITNSVDSVTSNPAVLTVNTAAAAPSITKHPAPVTVNEGGTATFTVEATGTQPFTYVWRKNGTDLPGTNSATLTLNAVKASDAGDYSVKITNSVDSATSNAAKLTVNPAGNVTISLTPTTASLMTGQTATFNATVSGSSNTAVNWTLDGPGSISGTTGASVTFTAAAAGTATLKAVAAADATKFQTATITIRSRDLNKDGVVDVLDLAWMAQAYGNASFLATADLNGDGKVDDADVTLLLAGL